MPKPMLSQSPQSSVPHTRPLHDAYPSLRHAPSCVDHLVQRTYNMCDRCATMIMQSGTSRPRHGRKLLSAGNGVIVHQSEKLGLVMTSRNTVPVSVGDIMLSFGAHPAEVEAKIRFLHPLHNFAILCYKPADRPMEVRHRCCNAYSSAIALQNHFQHCRPNRH